MTPRGHQGGRHVAAAFALLVAAAMIASTWTASASAKSPRFVYTCDWIAAHPAEAEAARVTCDPAVFFASLETGPALSAMTVQSEAGVMSTSCTHLPSNDPFHYLGAGVFSWTSYQYSIWWEWWDQTDPVHYTWYIQRTSGTHDWNHYAGPSRYHGPKIYGANIYRFGVQNHGNPWRAYVCWHDDPY